MFGMEPLRQPDVRPERTDNERVFYLEPVQGRCIRELCYLLRHLCRSAEGVGFEPTRAGLPP